MSACTGRDWQRSLPLLIAVVAVAFLLMKLPSLRERSWRENDELIYLSVAKNLEYNGRYTLQGTTILRRLPPEIYDKPLFHHPPLGVFLIVPLISSPPGESSPVQRAVFVSWLGHGLMVAGLALWLWGLLDREARRRVALPVLAVACLDPLGVFTGQKVWLDALMSGLVAMGTGLYVLATRDRAAPASRRLLVASGLVLGLALLTKVSALVALPILGFVWLARHGPRNPGAVLRGGARHLPWVLVPIVLVTLPWFVKFYGYYGTLLPTWTRPTPDMGEHFPFVADVMDRPPYYFFLEIFLLYPWLAFCAWTTGAAWRRRDADYALGWAFLLWIPFCFSGFASFAGYSYQLRYLAMAATPLYVIAALTLRDLWSRPRARVLFLTCLVLSNTAVSATYVVQDRWLDLRSLPRVWLEG